MIDGVKVKPLKVVSDDRGLLMEMLRSDDPDFQRFGQVYVTMVLPGVAKAWHFHKKQTDHFVCVGGRARIGLYDDRDGSPTKGETQTVILGFPDQALLVIPPGVYHGFTPAGDESAYIVNIPTELYNYAEPDEYRRPFDDPEIGYDWGAVTGG